MLRLSRRTLLRGGGALVATKLFAPNIIKPAKAAFILGKAGGGGGDWLLATGFWNDSGIWDDASSWMDAA